jgi:hypothetical protein
VAASKDIALIGHTPVMLSYQTHSASRNLHKEFDTAPSFTTMKSSHIRESVS